MSVEIKITGETAEKAHQEFATLARLMAGVKTVTDFSRPVEPTQPATVQELAKEVKPKQEVSQPQETSTKEEKPEVKETTSTSRKRRTKAEIAADLAAKEAEAKAEEEGAEDEPEETEEEPETSDAKETLEQEQAEAEEEPAGEEPKAETPEGSKYPAPFEDCKEDVDVLNKVRAKVAEIASKPGGQQAAAKIFANYKSAEHPNIPKLPVSKLIPFYNEIVTL